MLKRIIVGAGIAGLGWASYVAIRRWRETWGVDLDEANGRSPVTSSGSHVQRYAWDHVEAPRLVWPWLVQMGYGRGGVQHRPAGYARPRRRSSSAWQTLAVGDVVPTHPGGGSVKVLDRAVAGALCRHGDDAAAESVTSEAISRPGGFGSVHVRDASQFAASWTFVVELDARRSRLIERVRYWGEEGSPVTKLALSALAFGVFVMMQRQMVGIRSRAERLAVERSLHPAAVADTTPGNGHAPELKETLVASAGQS
jgi:hypothetical protein